MIRYGHWCVRTLPGCVDGRLFTMTSPIAFPGVRCDPLVHNSDITFMWYHSWISWCLKSSATRPFVICWLTSTKTSKLRFIGSLESTSNRWIPFTKGKWCEKHIRAMISLYSQLCSWIFVTCPWITTVPCSCDYICAAPHRIDDVTLRVCIQICMADAYSCHNTLNKSVL